MRYIVNAGRRIHHGGTEITELNPGAHSAPKAILGDLCVSVLKFGARD